MNYRHSKRAALAASVALVCAMACNSEDDKPVQDVTYMTFGPEGGASVAFGYSADKGLHFASIDGASTINMAVRSQSQRDEGGGSSFFSGSTGGSSSFSGSTGGSATFSGSTGGGASFSGGLAGVGAFTGTTIINGQACDLEGLCDFVSLICNSPDVQCEGFSDSECRAAVNNPSTQSQLSGLLEEEGLTGAFCAIVNYISCVSRGVTSIDQITDALAMQCAQSSGLLSLLAAQ
jgi:hypothetical protein